MITWAKVRLSTRLTNHCNQIRGAVPQSASAEMMSTLITKQLQPDTYTQEGTLHARRQAAMVIRTREHLKKLFDVLGPRYLYVPSVRGE